MTAAGRGLWVLLGEGGGFAVCRVESSRYFPLNWYGFAIMRRKLWCRKKSEALLRFRIEHPCESLYEFREGRGTKACADSLEELMSWIREVDA